MDLESLTYCLWGLSISAVTGEFTCWHAFMKYLICLRRWDDSFSLIPGTGQSAEQSFNVNRVLHETFAEEGIETRPR